MKRLAFTLAFLFATAAPAQEIFSLFQAARAIPGAQVGDLFCTSTTTGIIVPLHQGASVDGEVLTRDDASTPCKMKWSAGGGGSHALLSATHSDTLAAAVLRGALVVGNATPKWSLFALGTQYQVLQAGAADPLYDAVHLDQSAAVTGVLPNANTTATSANTPSTIVLRDGSGDFAAGTITASLAGTASGNVPNGRTLTGTAPVTVDGDNAAHDLSANRTIACATCATAAGTLTVNAPIIGAGGKALAVATAPTARSATVLNIDQATFHGDSDYSIAATDRTVATNATITAPRTWTLPAASAVNPGQTITIVDFAGGITVAANEIIVQRSGSDTVNGGLSIALQSQFAGVSLVSDGVSKWNATSGSGTIAGEGGGTVIGTPVIQRDNFDGDGATTDFTATFTPASNGTILVAVNGAIRDTTAYSISGSTLTISPALTSGMSIAWNYYTTLPGSATQTVETFTGSGVTDFTLAHDPIPNGVEAVGLNGLTQDVTKYSIVAPNIVRFAAAPITGASVTVTYLY